MKQFDRHFRIIVMAKLNQYHSKTTLFEGDVTFSAGSDRFSIALTSRETGIRYHLHLSESEAQRFAAFVADRVEIDDYETMR